MGVVKAITRTASAVKNTKTANFGNKHLLNGVVKHLLNGVVKHLLLSDLKLFV